MAEGVVAWAWKRISDASTVAWLFSLAASSSVSAYVVSVLPIGWHPPQYWAAAATAFFVTLFVAAGTMKLAAIAYAKLYPPEMDATPCGGEDATLVLKPTVTDEYYGFGWLTWEGERRKRPFKLVWRKPPFSVPATRREIRAGDSAPVFLAGFDGKNDTDAKLLIYGDSGVVTSWPLSHEVRTDGKWSDGYFKDDLHWIPMRIELRGTRTPRVWTYTYRLRLTKNVTFEVEKFSTKP